MGSKSKPSSMGPKSKPTSMGSMKGGSTPKPKGGGGKSDLKSMPPVKAEATPPPLPAYSQTLGERYLKHSYAAYCSTPSIKNWNCKWCESSADNTMTGITVVEDSHTDTLAFIGYNEANGIIEVTFRGTVPTSLQDWVDDLTFSKSMSNFVGGSVHKGFLNCYNALSAATKSAVKAFKRQYPKADVYFTGHSLGGAVATLAAADCVDSWGINAREVFLITFGSPRVGDATFATKFANMMGTRNWRVVNNHDLVPHVPPKVLGWHHVATEVWIHGGTTICNSSGEDPNCSDSLLIALSIPDHIHYYGYYQTCS